MGRFLKVALQFLKQSLLPNFEVKNILQFFFIKYFTINGRKYFYKFDYILLANKHLKMGKHFPKNIYLHKIKKNVHIKYFTSK